MRRVLVPLDGTPLAASILPDARRLAGPDGEIILIREISGMSHRGATAFTEQQEAVEACREYLLSVADDLTTAGVRVQVQPTVIGSPALAIDEAVRIFKADMIAAATHGRSLPQRLWWGSVAWKALAHSSVPVLLRHAAPEESLAERIEPRVRRILVPLDGSSLAEKALPLARSLAVEWNAATELVEVIPDPFVPVVGYTAPMSAGCYDLNADRRAADAYLKSTATGFDGVVHTRSVAGSAIERLVVAIQELQITDVVMASHGRTGLSRVIFGSVADALIQRLHLPIIVVPALATVHEEESAPTKTESEPVLVGEPW